MNIQSELSVYPYHDSLVGGEDLSSGQLRNQQCVDYPFHDPKSPTNLLPKPISPFKLDFSMNEHNIVESSIPSSLIGRRLSAPSLLSQAAFRAPERPPEYWGNGGTSLSMVDPNNVFSTSAVHSPLRPFSAQQSNPNRDMGVSSLLSSDAERSFSISRALGNIPSTHSPLSDEEHNGSYSLFHANDVRRASLSAINFDNEGQGSRSFNNFPKSNSRNDVKSPVSILKSSTVSSRSSSEGFTPLNANEYGDHPGDLSFLMEEPNHMERSLTSVDTFNNYNNNNHQHQYYPKEKEFPHSSLKQSPSNSFHNPSNNNINNSNNNMPNGGRFQSIRPPLSMQAVPPRPPVHGQGQRRFSVPVVSFQPQTNRQQSASGSVPSAALSYLQNQVSALGEGQFSPSFADDLNENNDVVNDSLANSVRNWSFSPSSVPLSPRLSQYPPEHRYILGFLQRELPALYSSHSEKLGHLSDEQYAVFECEFCPVCVKFTNRDISPDTEMMVLTCKEERCFHVMHASCLLPGASSIIAPHPPSASLVHASHIRACPAFFQPPIPITNGNSVRKGCTYQFCVMHALIDTVIAKWPVQPMNAINICDAVPDLNGSDFFQLFSSKGAIESSSKPLCFPFSRGRLSLSCISPKTKEEWSIRGMFDLSNIGSKYISQSPSSPYSQVFEIVFISTADRCTLTLYVHSRIIDSTQQWVISYITFNVPQFTSPKMTQKGNSNHSDRIGSPLRHGSGSFTFNSSVFNGNDGSQSWSEKSAHFKSNSNNNNNNNNGSDYPHLQRSASAASSPYLSSHSAPYSPMGVSALTGPHISLVPQYPNASRSTSEAILTNRDTMPRAQDITQTPMSPARVHPSNPTSLILMAKSQSGSRLLQSKLDSNDLAYVTQLHNALLPEMPALMKDLFGNYLIQRLIAVANETQRHNILVRCVPLLCDISCDRQGTRAVQKLIECIQTTREQSLLIDAITGNLSPIYLNNAVVTDETLHVGRYSPNVRLLNLIRDANGSHVIQAILDHFSSTFVQPIIRCAFRAVRTLGIDQHGLCVLKKCILLCSIEDFVAFAQKTVENILEYVNNQYGNYLIQSVIERANMLTFTHQRSSSASASGKSPSSLPNSPPQSPAQFSAKISTVDLSNVDPNTLALLDAVNESVYRGLRGHLSQLSRQKFSSNVIEKCLRMRDARLRSLIIQELITEDSLASLLTCSYGQYVLGNVLMVAESREEQIMMDYVRTHATPSGGKKHSHIKNKWERLLSQKASNNPVSRHEFDLNSPTLSITSPRAHFDSLGHESPSPL